MTWVNSKFKKKIEVKSGYTWSGDQELYENREGSTAVLRVSNIQDTLELDDILYLINVSEQHKIDKKISKNWTIAVNSNGNRNRVGKGIFIEEDMEFLFASFLVAFKPFDENEIDPRYFYYWYSSETVQKRISAIAEGTTGLSNLELRYLKSQDIYHPACIVEQRFIANTINAVDKTIQATKNSIAKLENLKTSLMQNLLTGKMKPDGSWRSEDEFWIDDKFGKVPNEFSFGRCKEFFVLQRGHDLTDNQATEGDFLVVKSNGPSIRHNAFKAEPPGVITGRSGTIGNVFFIEEKFWPHNTTLYVIDFKGNNPKFIYYLLIHLRLKDYLAGTGVPTLNRNDIHKLRVAIPNLETQNEIVLMLDSNVKSIELKIKKVDSLISLKKSLMQNLLTGKLRIPQEAFKK